MHQYTIALAICGLTDAFVYMIVAPSILFYVRQCGGTLEQYGYALSAFSFSNFIFKFFMGSWSDKIGFRKLFIGSFFVSVVGGALYTAAYQFGDYAVFIIGMSRVLTGIGAANSVLTYCYVARVVPHEEQTLMNTLLGMAKIIGMAGGPSFNVFLAHINIHLWDGAFVLDSLNSVGLLIMFFNFVSMMSVYFLLEEPEDFLLKLCPFSSIHKLELANKSNTKKNSTWIKILSSILCPNIIVPFCSIFAFNATFQLVETGITPAMSG